MNLSGFLNYVNWANLRVLEMLRSFPAVEPKALSLFSHMLAADHIWLSRMLNKTPDIAVWPELGLDECENLIQINLASYRDYLRSCDEKELSRIVTYRNTKGVDYKNSVLDILTHVVNHGSYHRGQIAVSVKRSGGEVVDTDYITFAREIH